VARIAEVIVMTGRKSKSIGFGVAATLVGVVLVFGAIGPLTERRDADGYYMSELFMVGRPSHAIVTGDIDLLRGRYETVVESSVVLAFVGDPAEVRMQGIASEPNALFMGIAASTAVEEYLGGVARDEITAWEADRADILDVEYRVYEGTVPPPGAPGTAGFWETSATGTGMQTLDWTIEPGDWTVVVMNADGSPGVMAELAFGAAPSDSVGTIVWTTFTLGIILLIGGVGLLYFALRRRGRDSTTPLPTGLPIQESVQQTERLQEETATKS
jgi:hypothetical protein